MFELTDKNGKQIVDGSVILYQNKFFSAEIICNIINNKYLFFNAHKYFSQIIEEEKYLYNKKNYKIIGNINQRKFKHLKEVYNEFINKSAESA